MRSALILLGLVLVGAPSAARATTWQVRQDGTGDFTTIQAAIDASATGDSIRVGAGRYLDYAYMSVGGNFNANVYVNVHVDSLTIIGEGADETIIGPPILHSEPPYGPIGFVVFSDVLWLRLENLRVDHIYTGIYRWLGRLEIDRCAFSYGRTGVAAWTDGGLEIRASTFEGNSNYGIVAFSYSENVEITECHFANNMSNVYFDSARNGNVSLCEFSSGTTGVTFSEGATGSVRDCNFTDIEHKAVVIGLNSAATVERNVVTGGEEAVKAAGLSHLTGCENRFEGQTYATVEVNNSLIDFENNQFMNYVQWAAYIPYYPLPPTVDLNMRNNYWGTDDPTEIAESIWDGHDDPDLHAVIEFEPFLQTTAVDELPGGGRLEFRSSPNPFNPNTAIQYVLQQTAPVTLSAYDLRGRLVRSLLAQTQQAAGLHELTWDGRDDAGAALPSGTYVLRLEAGGTPQSLRVSLIR